MGYENTSPISEGLSKALSGIGFLAGVVTLAMSKSPTASTAVKALIDSIASTTTVAGIYGMLTEDEIRSEQCGYKKFTISITYVWISPSKESSDGWEYKPLKKKKQIYYYMPGTRRLYGPNKKFI